MEGAWLVLWVVVTFLTVVKGTVLEELWLLWLLWVVWVDRMLWAFWVLALGSIWEVGIDVLDGVLTTGTTFFGTVLIWMVWPVWVLAFGSIWELDVVTVDLWLDWEFLWVLWVLCVFCVLWVLCAFCVLWVLCAFWVLALGSTWEVVVVVTLVAGWRLSPWEEELEEDELCVEEEEDWELFWVDDALAALLYAILLASTRLSFPLYSNEYGLPSTSTLKMIMRAWLSIL